MRIVKILFLFIGLQAFCQQTNLTSLQGQAFQSRVIKKAEGINSFKANFTLFKHIEMMEDVPESKGMVYYQSPNLLKWEYSSPEDYQVLYRDSKLYVSENGDTREVDLASNRMFEKVGEMIAGSVNGKILKANKDFDISYFKEKNSMKARVIPKDQRIAGMFSEIWMNFNKENLIESVRLIDPSGDYTEIKLQNIVINQDIPKKVFKN
ncbi:LolA family protein [Christiangramia flava]|uniref:Outer membrane lipoprotein carrier protein LolA n=1 Tax=Christiangramia flava JLT2011 TaxID=1229726 RepID=A0A1L7I8W4_9FLAO|nr:outer membrane lipoprotein carrier protein LolA [Christiangramia flava]APU70051.1 Outer membrane lipoprotein carrier protein LolA [Christiangramia flava JLT2011]OSS39536.1 Outer membrane lipoprotein carrier protein LolA [Christiangramia flava JLT2011]